MHMYIMPHSYFFLNVAFFQRRKIYNRIDERYYPCYFGVKKEGILSENIIIFNFLTNKLEIFL